MSETIAALPHQPTDYEKRREALYHCGGDIAKAQELYAFLIGATPITTGVAETVVVKTDTPKATKPKAEKIVETPAEAKPDAPAKLDYLADILPKVMDAANTIAAQPGKDIVQGKAEVVAMMKAKFGVGNAKEVPEAKWPAFLAELDTLTPKEAANV